jgi:hypothetical protein
LDCPRVGKSVLGTLVAWCRWQAPAHRIGHAVGRDARPWQALRQTANWFDPIEAGLRDRAREFLQAMLEAELDEVLDRSRYARRAKRSSGDSEATAGATPRRRTQSSLVSGLPRWSAPLMVDSFQAAFLTGCWAWRSSYCAGLR